MHSSRPLVVLLFLVSSVAASRAADAPYIGLWKLNFERSQFGTSLVYDTLPGGRMRSTRDGQAYEFKDDDKEYKTRWGVTRWKRVGPNAWDQTLITTADKLVTRARISISSDGRTLTIDGTSTPPNSQPMKFVEIYRRISGGPGLSGKWALRNGSTSTLQLVAAGADQVTMTDIETQATCTAKLDGQPSPVKVLGAPNIVCSMKKAGRAGLNISFKEGTNFMGELVLTPSADGRTMSAAVTNVNGSKDQLVFDRQR